VLKSKIPKNANVLRRRFIVTIEDSGTDREVFKARNVARGFNDIGKAHFKYDSPVSKPESTSIILSLAACSTARTNLVVIFMSTITVV
jgi:hypothetical protein